MCKKENNGIGKVLAMERARQQKTSMLARKTIDSETERCNDNTDDSHSIATSDSGCKKRGKAAKKQKCDAVKKRNRSSSKK